jgi:uncharacterized protein YfaA (DUF2138 family)
MAALLRRDTPQMTTHAPRNANGQGVTVTRTRRLILLATLLLAPLVVVLYRTTGWAQYGGRQALVAIDVAHPDVMIRTRSLSALPRDLLRVPLAHDLLTEDFVFYYEEHPDRLGLVGTLRRIAYEHDLRWTDEAVKWVLDQPADVLLWRGPTGALDYWLISVSRRELAKLLQEAATIAMKDRQLTLAGHVTVDGQETDVYALEYAPRHTLLAAAYGDHVVVLSHPGLLLDEGIPRPDREALVARLLTGTAPADADFAADAAHSLIVRTHYLSFGYQRFFPGLEALRFDFGAETWATHALLDHAHLAADALDDHDLWKSVPANPALCALLPVDWSQGAALVEHAPAHGDHKPADLASALAGPAAICWYSEGRLHTPLVVAMLKESHGDLGALFEGLFDWSIRATDSQTPLRARHPAPDTSLWQRRVEVPYARVDADGALESGPLTVTLAAKGRVVLFSPDAKLVRQGLATAEKRFPSVGDSLGDSGTTLAVLLPRELGHIGGKEAMMMLPSGDEPVFRTAAEQQLLPRLGVIGKYPAYRLALGPHSASGRGWERVDWQELSR